MHTRKLFPGGWRGYAVLLGLWLLFGVFDSTLGYLHPGYASHGLSFLQVQSMGLANYLLWALYALAVFQLARLFPLEQLSWPYALLVHVPACVLLAMLRLALEGWISRFFPLYAALPLSFLDIFHRLFTTKFPSLILVYWLLLGVHHAVAYYRKYRERELTASQLEARLAQAQLQVLKMQLQPHFLFNTLHAISALMHQDVELADRMLARLAELLRSALDSAGTQEVPLSQELDFIKPYLEIEQARLGPRLSVQLDIDPEVLDVPVPNLILQPLVENAIRHGIVPCAEAGCIGIRARREGEFLRLQISDNGAGLSSNYVEGVGVFTTRARLRHLYGNTHDFVLKSGPNGGVVVDVALPFRTDPEYLDRSAMGGNGANPSFDRG
jgi:signal transduction histidine kinase